MCGAGTEIESKLIQPYFSCLMFCFLFLSGEFLVPTAAGSDDHGLKVCRYDDDGGELGASR